MPKRKTADVKVEPATDSRNRTSSAKPKTAAAATHKRTNRKAPAEVETDLTTPVANATPVAVAALPAPVPAQNEIAALAYSYWQARGYQHGDPIADWLRAERELTELAQNR